MATSYAADHASALADVREAGADVVFSFPTPGVGFNAVTETWTTPPGTGTLTGAAIEETGSLIRYQALGLVVTKARTLFFVADVYGPLPPMNATIAWSGVPYSVKDVSPVSPSGQAIASRVVVVS